MNKLQETEQQQVEAISDLECVKNDLETTRQEQSVVIVKLNETIVKRISDKTRLHDSITELKTSINSSDNAVI